MGRAHDDESRVGGSPPSTSHQRTGISTSCVTQTVGVLPPSRKVRPSCSRACEGTALGGPDNVSSSHPAALGSLPRGECGPSAVPGTPSSPPDPSGHAPWLSPVPVLL